ncbi:aromatic ring-hydroxylating dioxygenase subunit alpha [Streptomyces sp. NBC_00631]|uniref:aromatic ring-hydroxylating dioxygenase subunit alpha n=1 Tax=Streptomyces sp. NBC_00631 TaxID=2975793 RepID=UPI0030E502F9
MSRTAPLQAQAVDSFADPGWYVNGWYAAARSGELGPRTIARTICGHNLVLFRLESGSATALADACWHKLAPLSKGTVQGDTLVCPYHGLRYDGHGRCVHMPAQETVHPGAAVRSFPLVERYGLCWVWMGDPSLADPAEVPDYHWNSDPEYVSGGSYMRLDCNYKLLIDNLMDLTHEEFVHSSSIGSEALSVAPFDVTHGERTATVTRWMTGIEAPPFWTGQLQRNVPVDRWQIVRFEAPSVVSINVGVAPTGTGAPEGDRSQGVDAYVLNAITPETEHSTHYFWGYARSYRMAEAELTEQLVKGITGIFTEDKTILEAQQRAMFDNPDKIFYNLNLDGGGMWARRIIDARVAHEKRATQLNGTGQA